MKTTRSIYVIVLTVLFSGIGVYLFDKIWGNQINWENFRETYIVEFLATRITVLQILIFAILALAIYQLLRKLFKKDSRYNKKQRKLRRYNNSKNPKSEIIYRWGVHFDVNDNPWISGFEAFCDKHQKHPIRLINDRCPVPDCENNTRQINFAAVKNYIESDLIDRWNKIK